MKLLFCRECEDIFKLRVDEPKACACGQSVGSYNADGINAWVEGPCEVICLSNTTLAIALAGGIPEKGYGPGILAWFAGRDSDTIKFYSDGAPSLGKIKQKDIDYWVSKIGEKDKK